MGREVIVDPTIAILESLSVIVIELDMAVGIFSHIIIVHKKLDLGLFIPIAKRVEQ